MALEVVGEEGNKSAPSASSEDPKRSLICNWSESVSSNTQILLAFTKAQEAMNVSLNS